METITIDQKQEKTTLDSNTTKNQIYTIYERYYELSLKCARDKDLLEAFQDPENTVAFMTDGKKDNTYVWIENGKPWKGCGMKIPQNTRVILDYETAWPNLYFTKKGGSKETVTIKESPLFVQVFSNGKEGIKTIKRELLAENGVSKVILPFDTEDLQYYDAILILPCFIPNKDMLTKVYCKDNKETAEIILTTS
ncbi:hypothetical protein AWE51_10605 [Aquimarina aggregata]|uniref:Uncharacterized protein n=1 Tax=Aquimarina aggregata TaxID=1642818 RepID=A0A162Y9L0_9FLAO|nr:hypothetical protein [Aquimarina aggregata]KZS39009.1 hypothetical protein AWE51_10605 [Aquimarina aggregata]